MEYSEQDMKISANKVRHLRIERGWSQEQLAAASGLGLRTIQRVEAEGKAARETRVCLAATFAVELADLLEAPEPDNAMAAQPAPQARQYKIALVLAGVALLPMLLNTAGVVASGIWVSAGFLAAIVLGLYGGFGAYFTGAPRHSSRIKRYAQAAFIAFAVFGGFALLAGDKAGIGIAAQVTILALGIYFLVDCLAVKRQMAE